MSKTNNNHPTNSIRILIADDNRIVVMVIQRMLAEYAHVTVDKAVNGQEALTILENNQYDILITDYQMPLLNGPELANKARQLQPELYIVLMSGYPPKRLESLLDTGTIDDYLPKPPSQDDLSRMLQNIT
ncbi:MAG TPA: response regulator [Anaerolineae bacterium]|nr:response regulator [Anaerolineae bacterium]